MSLHEPRQKVIQAALSYAASEKWSELNPDSSHEDAEMELKVDMLDSAIREYVEARLNFGDALMEAAVQPFRPPEAKEL